MFGCNSRLTGDIFMKWHLKRQQTKGSPRIAVVSPGGSGGGEDASGHGRKQPDVLRGNFHLGLIASVGGVHHHH